VADEPALAAFIDRNFSGRLKPLGLASKPGESVANSLLREALVELLVEEGNDPALTAELSKAAHAFVSSGGENLGGIAPELSGEAMRAAVKGDPAFANAVFDLLNKSDDEYLQGRLIQALAASNDDAALQKLAGMTLSPHIRIGDIRFIEGSLPQSEKGRTVMWAWFKANIEAVKKRVSAYGLGGAPNILGNACDAGSKAELNAFFGPRVGEMTGGPRNLREVNDQIDRCIALKQAKGTEIAAALKTAL
jgi:alanyl aminopeptidase